MPPLPFMQQYHVCFISPVKLRGFPPAASPRRSASFCQGLWNNTMLLDVCHIIPTGQEKAFFYMDMMDGPSDSRRAGARRGRKGDGTRLTQDFEKFIEILAPLHLPGAGKVGHVCWGWGEGCSALTSLVDSVTLCAQPLVPLALLYLFLFPLHADGLSAAASCRLQSAL